MFFSYVIQSERGGSYYKGHCENMEKRLLEHNSGMTESIKGKTPFKLVFFESFLSRPEAIKREKYYKTAAGRRFLNKKIVGINH